MNKYRYRALGASLLIRANISFCASKVQPIVPRRTPNLARADGPQHALPIRMRYVCAGALLNPGHAADVCNPAIFPGVYGLMLSGTTTISGESKQVVSVARLVFDNSGKVTGTSSVNFGGLLLGNPVTGEYTLKSDCSLGWKLQDDSGNLQNFAGKLSLDGRHVEFGQTDAGTPQRGVMVRTAESCPSSDFRGRYRVRITGTTMDMETGKATGESSASMERSMRMAMQGWGLRRTGIRPRSTRRAMRWKANASRG